MPEQKSVVTQMKPLGKKINTAASSGHLKKSGNITEAERQSLMNHGHHVEHRDDDDGDPTTGRPKLKTVNRTVRTTVYVPEERMVKVPVVRKEKEKIIEKHTIKASKLVPVTKYKNVNEVHLHDRKPAPGEKAKSGDPKTQVLKTSEAAGKPRQIPYQDFVEKEYEITVDVPREVVKTRVGYRMDKQLYSHAVDVMEDCVFELRPVLISKGQARAKTLENAERHGKALHGDPVWSDTLHDGWRPEYGCTTPTGSRPGSAASRPGTGMSHRPYTGMTGSPTGGMPPIGEFTTRPGTGSRSAPNLHRR